MYDVSDKRNGQGSSCFYPFFEVESRFGFLKFVSAGHIGMEVPKQILGEPRSSLVLKRSMVREIVDKVSMYQPSNDDYLQKALNSI